MYVELSGNIPNTGADPHRRHFGSLAVYTRIEMEEGMGFNYGREKRRFDKEWERLEEEYTAAGMPYEVIEHMKTYDWKWFCSQRVYHNRTQNLPSESCNDESEQSSLLRKFASLSVQPAREELFSGRLAWLNTVEDQILYQRLCSLSVNDLELITLIAFDGYKQSEVARLWGCSWNVIHKRLQKIKKILQRG